MSEKDIAEIREFNSLLREYAESTPNCFYVDVFEHKELWDPDMFVADGIHFTYEGYTVYGEIWKDALKNELEKF